MDHKDGDKAALVQAHQLQRSQERLSELGEGLSDLERQQRDDRARLDALSQRSASLLARIGVEASEVDHSTLEPSVRLSAEERAGVERGLPHFEPLSTLTFESWGDYQRQVDAYTQTHALDLTTDPIAQLLGPRRVAEVERRFHASFGDLRWNQWDYAAVGLAATLATLVDLVLVRIPRDMNFLGRDYAGSPVTKLFRETADTITDGGGESPLLQWLAGIQGKLERWAKVTYDLSANSKARGIDVPGLRPGTHRLMSLGHDPVLGFVFGTLESLGGVCSLIDRTGKLHLIANAARQLSNPLEAIVKVMVHLLSDLTTRAGLQPPFFTLTQLLSNKSGFVLREGGAPVTYADAARWMYTHGYTLGHFATMSLVPLLIELLVQVYFKLANFEALYDAGAGIKLGANVKLASMLTMAHSLAAGGNVVKMLLYGWNPAAFNWAQMLALARSFWALWKADSERRGAIEESLVEGWGRLVVGARG